MKNVHGFICLGIEKDFKDDWIYNYRNLDFEKLDFLSASKSNHNFC